MDSSNSEEKAIANVEEDITPRAEKVPNVVYNFDTNKMIELKAFLKTLHVSF